MTQPFNPYPNTGLSGAQAPVGFVPPVPMAPPPSMAGAAQASQQAQGLVGSPSGLQSFGATAGSMQTMTGDVDKIRDNLKKMSIHNAAGPTQPIAGAAGATKPGSAAPIPSGLGQATPIVPPEQLPPGAKVGVPVDPASLPPGQLPPAVPGQPMSTGWAAPHDAAEPMPAAQTTGQIAAATPLPDPDANKPIVG